MLVLVLVLSPNDGIRIDRGCDEAVRGLVARCWDEHEYEYDFGATAFAANLLHPETLFMRLLITGICGFVGKAIVERLTATLSGLQIVGIDNLSRPGSPTNRARLKTLGVQLLHGDVRMASDLEEIAPVDWVIDAAANPSVLAGVRGVASSRQLAEHNLLGTINLLEWCRTRGAGLIELSSSRVYSITALTGLPLTVKANAFRLDAAAQLPSHVSAAGITEQFSTTPPISLYGATKLASELLALEYAAAFQLPLWINRCGVIAGAGQFGKADQGIFAYWLHRYQQRAPLRYIGFGRKGYQVRDCLHPYDLADLIAKQMQTTCDGDKPKVINVSGGIASARSLAELTQWCEQRWGRHAVSSDAEQRPYDLPWVVLDNALARSTWGWTPEIGADAILSEIAEHAEKHPEWLDLSDAR